MLYGAMNSPLCPLDREIEVIAQLGFDYLEMTMDPPHAHHSVVRKRKAELFKTLRRLRMQLICHLPTFVSTADMTESLREASVQEVLLSMRVASGLGPLKVVLHPSFIQGLGTMMLDQSLTHATQAMERILEEGNRLNLTVCVENLFPRSLSLVAPEDFRPLFERFPDARLALDTGHAHIGRGGEERILTFIRSFPAQIRHVHASDNSGRDDEHLPIGVGSVDFPRIVKALKKIGYDDTITLEVFSRDRDYLRISKEKLSVLFERL